MPKRDEAYMQAQRDTIARAALSIFLEKGAYSVSLREICAAAGISIGALYVHFDSREALVAAACVVAWQDSPMPPVANWSEYESFLAGDLNISRQAQYAGINRLALQLVAELPHLQDRPEGLVEVLQDYRSWFVTALTTLERGDEIGLPLGLGPTTEIHMQLAYGAFYQTIIDRDTPITAIADTLRLALATTAGRRT